MIEKKKKIEMEKTEKPLAQGKERKMIDEGKATDLDSVI